METYETTQIKNILKKVTPISIGYIKILKHKKKIEIVQMLHQVINLLGSMANLSTLTSHNLLQTQLRWTSLLHRTTTHDPSDMFSDAPSLSVYV